MWYIMVLEIMKKYWKQNIFILILTSIESGGIILSTMYLARIMESLIAYDKTNFLFAILLSVSYWLLSLIVGFVKNKYIELTKQKQILALRNRIIHAISKMSYLEFQDKDINDYSSWITNDINIIEEQTFNNFYQSLSSATLILFSAVAIFMFNKNLLIITLISAILMLLIPKLMQKKLDQKNALVSSVYENYLTKVDEWIKGFPTLISYNKKSLLQKKLALENDKIFNVKIELYKTKIAVNVLLKLISVIFQYLIIFTTGFLILSGKLSGGVIFSIGDLTGNFFGNMSFFLEELVTFISTSKILNKIPTEQNYSEKNKGKYELLNFNKEIIVTDLSYKYVNGKTIHFPAMIFKKGKKYAVLGESGKGKSTFLNILSKNLIGYQGIITIDGINLSKIDTERYNNQLAYIKQSPYIFDSSLNENISLFDNYDADKMKELIDEFKLNDLRTDEKLGLFGSSISGGQKQRIEIARSLITHHSILLIDEGTSNLDKNTAYIIEKYLLANPSMTIIVVTHHLNPKLKHLFSEIYHF